MKSVINELWHGNIISQENSRTNSKEIQELLGYIARHHDDLLKTMSEEQQEIFIHIRRVIDIKNKRLASVVANLGMLAAVASSHK